MQVNDKSNAFRKRLARADAIMASQMNAQGIMRPFEKWPRNLRREFSRITMKTMATYPNK